MALKKEKSVLVMGMKPNVISIQKKRKKALENKRQAGVPSMKLEDRVNIVLDMCNREIKRQEVFMNCAEHHNNEKDWIKHYELQGLYMSIRDILNGNFEIEE